MKAAVMTQRTGAGRDGPLSITRPTRGHALMQTSEGGRDLVAQMETKNVVDPQVGGMLRRAQVLLNGRQNRRLKSIWRRGALDNDHLLLNVQLQAPRMLWTCRRGVLALYAYALLSHRPSGLS